MEMSAEIVDGKLCHITLIGRMDVEGIASIDKKFTATVEEARQPIIVDMSNVPYILINAKSAGAMNKKYFIVGPQDEVENVLKISGIDQLITIYKEIGDAIAHL